MRVACARAVALALALAIPCRDASAADDVESLVRDLGAADATLRYPAYSKLNARKDPAAIPLLLKALPGYESSAQDYGVLVVQAYPPDLSRPALRKLAAEDAPYLKVAAGAALLRAGEAKAAGTVVEGLEAKGLDVTTRILMFVRLTSLRDEGVQRAVRSILSPDANVAVLGAALSYLASVEDAAAKAPAERLLESSEVGVRAAAAAFLFRLGDEARAEELAKVLASGEVTYADFSRVHSLLYSVPHLPDAVLDAATKILDAETDRYYLAAVVGFLGQHAYVKAIPALKKLLDHPEASVSKAAFDALSKCPGALAPDDLKGLLSSPDEARRVAAAEALRRIDDLSGLSAAVEVLKSGSTTALRVAAAVVVGGFRSPAAVDALLAALSDPESSVRSVAFSELAQVLPAVFPHRRLDLSSTGFSADAAPAAREAAVAKIRSWWELNRHRDW